MDKKVYLVLFVSVLLLLLSPLLFKPGFSEGVFTSEETYYNLLIINDFRVESDWLVFLFSPFHFFLSNLGLSDTDLAMFVPVITGLLSVLLLFFILRRFNLSDNEIVYVLALLALTPVFLHNFTALNPSNFGFPLFLLSLLLYFYRPFLAFIPLLLLVFINPLLSVVFVLFVVSRMLLSKKNRLLNAFLVFFGAAFFVVYLLFGPSIVFIESPVLDNVLVELGSSTGYSIPLFILSALGVFVWWEKKTEKTIVVLSLFLGFVLSLFIPDLSLVVALGLSVFAGIGVNKLINMNWELEKIKNYSLMLIFYVILFSAIITINIQVTQVSEQEVEAAKFLRSINSEGVVLSTPDKGFMIQYLSGKETFVDSKSFLEDDYEFRVFVLDEIFYSLLLSDLKIILEENNIKYFFIHKDMKDGGVWTGREEGLQFFLIHSEHFVKLFDNEFVEIYRFNRDA